MTKRLSRYSRQDFKDAAASGLVMAIIALAPSMAIHTTRLFTLQAWEAMLSVSMVAFVGGMAGYLHGLTNQPAAERWEPGDPERRKRMGPEE